MKFYIYQNSSWVEKKAQLLAIQEDAKDETLDTACVQLFFDKRATPYEARTLCKILQVDDTYITLLREYFYYIATDNVETQTVCDGTFKHTLTLVQTTRNLSHYVLPNMVITQPRLRTASTYFCCENSLNPQYYYINHATAQPTGIASWDGFTTRVFDITEGTFSCRKTVPSPYWIECLAVTEHTQVQKAIIRIRQKALVGTADVDGSNAKAYFTDVNRKFASPSWLRPMLRVFHTNTNINTLNNDTQYESEKEVLFTVDYNNLRWTDEGGVFELSESQLATLNSYTSGYISCEFASDVPTSASVPSAFLDETSGDYISVAYDRLFVDKTEFTTNHIQTVFAYVTLEVTYKRAMLSDTISKIAARQQCAFDNSVTAPLFSIDEDTGDPDYVLLSTTESPEFSFNGVTVFEALSQVLETVDALPRFNAEPDSYGTYNLSLDYYNQTGGSIGTTPKFSAYSSNATEQKRDNGVLTNFQNAETLSYFPCKPVSDTPIYARARVASYGIPELADYVLAVDKPIKYIDHLWLKSVCSYKVLFPTDETYTWGDKPTIYNWVKVDGVPFPVDTASFIFDEATYSSALGQGDYPLDYNHNIRIQKNCLKFKKGGEEIKCGNKATDAYNNVSFTLWECYAVSKDRAIGRFCLNYRGFPNATHTYYSYGNTETYAYVISFCDSASFKDVWFACQYGTDLSGRLEVQSPYPKEKGQFLVSSGSASTDISKLGLNMLGVALRSGEPTMTCGQLITTWDKRIQVGQVFTYSNEKWIATKASYTTLASTALDTTIKGTIEFTKNFNGLSKRIAIDQSKRLYNIDRAIANLCEVNIVHYVYAEFLSRNGTSETGSDVLPISDSHIAGLFLKALSDDESLATEVSYATLGVNGDASIQNIYMPLAVYGSGNCVCFEAKMEDPISAGVKMTDSTDGTTYWWATDAWQKMVGSTYYYGTDVKYADDEGYATAFDVKFFKATGNTAMAETLPYIPNHGGEEVIAITNLKYDKQPNEIFGINYELAFLSVSHTTSNEVFFSKRFFDAWNDRKGLRLKWLRFYFSEDTADRYGYSDTKGKGDYYDVEAYEFVYMAVHYICFSVANYLCTQTKTVHLSSLALCDQDGNILISSNCNVAMGYTKGKAPNLPRLHFFARQERL